MLTRNHLNIALVLLLSSSIFGCKGGSRQAGPPKENAFRYALEAKVPSLDPARTNDVYSSQTQALFYERLYEYNYLKRPLQLEPSLAESLPVISKDKKKITIKLKKGIFFHDDPCFEKTNGKGREFVANDVVYLFERAAAPKFMGPLYAGIEDSIVGVKEFHDGKTTTISGVKALDQNTVEIQLRKALPRFSYSFVDPRTAILPKECVEKYGEGIARHPIGTGPFLIKEAELEHKIVAVKNPNYKTMTFPTDSNYADSGKALPFVDKVIFEVIPEVQPRWLRFLAGDFDVAVSIPKDNVPELFPNNKLAEKYTKMGIQHFREIKGDVTVYTFNMRDPVWGKKKELRQAFALAIDVDKIIEIQYAGQAIRAHSIVDPTQYGYNPTFKSKWAKRDLAKAKELLAKAGYPEGKGLPPLTMLAGSDTTARNLSDLLTRQLAEAGIVLKPEPMTWPELSKRLHGANFMLCGLGYASGTPDVDDATGLVHSRNIPSGSNPSGYTNPEIDKLVDDIEMMENGPARLAKVHRFQEILDEDLPIVTVSHRVSNQLIQPWLKNHVYTDNMYFGPWVKFHRIETATAGSKK